MLAHKTSSNHILSNLTNSDLRLIETHLDFIELPKRLKLSVRNQHVDQIYFIESGIASVVANGSNPIEIGIIGREGMTGLSVVLGNDDPIRHETNMQVAGNGYRIPATALRSAMAASTTLQRPLLAYVHAFMKQITQTAVANGRSNIEQRLARWLLLARDRIDYDELPLTHDLLAVMLGVRRSGVTVALHELARKGLVTYKRGTIVITDRKGLEANSNGIYSPLIDNSKGRFVTESSIAGRRLDS